MAAPAHTHPRPTAEENIVPVPITDVAYEAVRTHAQRKGQSVAEAIREAIAFTWYLEEALDQGGRIVIERSDGTREIFSLKR